MTGASQASILEALCRQGWVPLEIDIAKESRERKVREWSWRSLLQRRAQASPRELMRLTQSLAVLLGAGLTIDRALQINAAMNARPGLRSINEALLKGVRSGQTLSAAFAASGQSLPHFFRSMVEAGEVGGALPQALSRMVELQERQLDVQERVRSALVYPALLAGVVLLTLVMLLTFVLPRFEVLFAESEQQLPWSTAAVLAWAIFWQATGGLWGVRRLS